MDIDYFKNYNDLNGHQKGDEVLRIISDKLKAFSREKDVVSRYGGEEFAIILPDTSEQDAFEIAEKIRSAIQEECFPGQEYMPNKNLTISVGVSIYPFKAKTEEEIVKYADEALYRAKFLRKNRVESYYSILDDLQNDINENDKEIITSIKTLIAVINAKDKYTFRHVERVVSYCSLMAEKLNFDDHTKRMFIYTAYMHDIGKINIPQGILIKSTSLTNEEWKILKGHPENGAEIIKNVSVLKEVVPIILQHHEHYDGSGYPNKLKGNEICYLARLLTVIDSFDAMTSNRPYQKKKSFSLAFDELVRCSGTQFDPEIVQAFIRIIKDDFDN
jgi:diguanylate cyclase (GGDEF)-like protein/putative nucleotidyltransferase with HDIG domain